MRLGRGTTYIGASSYHDDSVVSALPASRTITSNLLMISQGPGPNMIDYTLINEHYDANGNLTAVTYTSTLSCVG